MQVKHWRKIDFSCMGIGFVLIFTPKYFMSQVHALGFVFVGVVVLITGFVGYMYDIAIEKAGCMEKVAREM